MNGKQAAGRPVSCGDRENPLRTRFRGSERRFPPSQASHGTAVRETSSRPGGRPASVRASSAWPSEVPMARRSLRSGFDLATRRGRERERLGRRHSPLSGEVDLTGPWRQKTGRPTAALERTREPAAESGCGITDPRING